MRYRFGSFELDVQRLELRAGGEARPLEPQVFDLLRLLVENAGRVVSRDELIDAVWNGRVVSDATVSTRISALRRALGDDGESQAVIRTVPRRGFRLMPPVREAGEDADAAEAGAQAGTAPPAVIPERPSIAVLPFSSLGSAEQQQIFADGMTEEIITMLSKVSEMVVVARAAVFAVQGRPATLRQTAGELGVRYLVEGSVRSAGNRIRVAAQLLDARDGRHLWADRYDRELTDIFSLQDEITYEIVTALQVKLTEGEQARVLGRRTRALAAWEAFLRGLSEYRRSSREGMTAGLALLERAVELDPGFAAAWASLGRCHWQFARHGWSGAPAESLQLAATHAERALACPDSPPDGHALLGMVKMLERRFDQAIEAGQKAIELGPSVAENHVELAQTLNYAGRPEQAAALLERATRLSPFYPDNMLGVLANNRRLLGRHDEAIQLDRERLRRSPDNFYSDFRLAAVYMQLGRTDEARFHAGEALKKHPALSLAQVRFSEPYRDPDYQQHYLDLLRQAGLPE